MTQAEIDALVARHVAEAAARFKTHIDAVVTRHTAGGARPFIASTLDVRPRSFAERDAGRVHAYDEAAASVARRMGLDPTKYADKAKIAEIVAREQPTSVPMYGSRGLRAEEACYAEATSERDVQWNDALHAMALKLYGKGLDQLSTDERRRVTASTAQTRPDLIPTYGRAASLPSDPRHVNAEGTSHVEYAELERTVARQHGLDPSSYAGRSAIAAIIAREHPAAIPAYGTPGIRRSREAA